MRRCRRPSTARARGNARRRTAVALVLATALVAAGCGGDDGPAGGGDASTGEEVFTSQGCAGCHTLEEAGSSGTVGPDLDETLADQEPAQIRESIVDPEARITPGFPDGVMPSDYGQRLDDDELQALVRFLAPATSGSAGG